MSDTVTPDGQNPHAHTPEPTSSAGRGPAPLRGAVGAAREHAQSVVGAAAGRTRAFGEEFAEVATAAGQQRSRAVVAVTAAYVVAALALGSLVVGWIPKAQDVAAGSFMGTVAEDALGTLTVTETAVLPGGEDAPDAVLVRTEFVPAKEPLAPTVRLVVGETTFAPETNSCQLANPHFGRRCTFRFLVPAGTVGEDTDATLEVYRGSKNHAAVVTAPLEHRTVYDAESAAQAKAMAELLLEGGQDAYVELLEGLLAEDEDPAVSLPGADVPAVEEPAAPADPAAEDAPAVPLPPQDAPGDDTAAVDAPADDAPAAPAGGVDSEG
ncbi:hypothetical protein [Corynebacterium sp. 13CS0277]|uniref:hypothetical protein n=1 Tax=Corynebacterium sp. 13CS0277 TaxID=2071994 RepID=UPI0018EB8C28|nr:hypothetical protein [Corynebacterium sp. 13CS0277]